LYFEFIDPIIADKLTALIWQTVLYKIILKEKQLNQN